ncbi:MAG: thiolase family protein [Proteobacteria bacterium]|nr:thiolase family protein [Pseudomonadota bacterium]MBU4574648.1 thiolase family protein [Pseudomonadota bacterium]MBU4596932.1 thiolase family protein [Pseudomonadota bacterium]
MSQEVVIVGACRTAIGRHGGALRSMSALELSIPVMQEVLRRAGVDPALIEVVIWGCNYQKTYQENNLARVAAVKAGLPVSVPGITVHRNCTSSMSSIQLGYYQIKAGEAQVIMAGGADSMSNASYTIDKLRWGSRLGHAQVRDSMWDSLTELGVGPAMGITAENLAQRYAISREEQDQMALLSQQRAARAIREGRFADEILPLEVKQKKRTVLFEVDEHPRPDTTLESLAGLPPAFKKDGTVTAGNASGINDGAAGMLLMSREMAEDLGAPIMARILGTATSGVEPEVMGIGPVEATRRALDKAGLALADMELIELNEAFAAQYLACEKEMGLNREITNVNGSGISLGHPVGCTGARITTTLLHEMAKRGLRRGLAALCAGGGMGTALVVERPNI